MVLIVHLPPYQASQSIQRYIAGSIVFWAVSLPCCIEKCSSKIVSLSRSLLLCFYFFSGTNNKYCNGCNTGKQELKIKFRDWDLTAEWFFLITKTKYKCVSFVICVLHIFQKVFLPFKLQNKLDFCLQCPALDLQVFLHYIMSALYF